MKILLPYWWFGVQWSSSDVEAEQKRSLTPKSNHYCIKGNGWG
jgi:hypothetical protein